jgi:RNA polymerase sigma factor (TIGR02999 family)
MRKMPAKTHITGKISCQRGRWIVGVHVVSFSQLAVLSGGESMRRAASAHDVTLLLRAWGDGSKEALDRLAPLVYRELHGIAGRLMAGERANHTLQATALVNEAYLRLVDARQVSWQDRAHFFGICARAMRQILVDHARSRASAKRGGDQVVIELDDALAAGGSPAAGLLELDDALNRLAQFDPRKCQVVEMRYFGGLSIEETAEALKVSAETVRRDWNMAQAWLHRELTGKTKDG